MAKFIEIPVILTDNDPDEVAKYQEIGIKLPENDCVCPALLNIEHIILINPASDEAKCTMRTTSADFMINLSYEELKKIIKDEE